jgi:hypothetical protein
MCRLTVFKEAIFTKPIRYWQVGPLKVQKIRAGTKLGELLSNLYRVCLPAVTQKRRPV